MTGTAHHCAECGLTYYYDERLHVCAFKADALPGNEHVGESWVDQCMRMQRSQR